MSTGKLGSRAIVVGGSIAGKLAARVLADYFHEVIIIEKDIEPKAPMKRGGVPQGSQGHALLKSGEDVLEEFFPGIVKEFLEDGSVSSDFSRDLSWYHHGSWKVRESSKILTIQQSRPFLEYHLQRRLEQISTIQYIYGAKVDKLVVDSNEGKVTGIEYQMEAGQIESLQAELIIDAAGAATLTPRWLKELGYPSPSKEELQVNLFYVSRTYRSLSPGVRDWKGLLVYPNPPQQTSGGGIYQIEDNKWMVTLFGYGTHTPPKDEKQFLEYAATLDHPSLFGAIIDGKPASDISVYRFPTMRKYRYEKMKRFPNGLIVIGDAFGRIDPVFAQGMSLAALEAKALKNVLLHATKNQSLIAISKKVHRQFQRVLTVPWLIASIEDFRFSHTAGKRMVGLSFLQAFIKKVMLACSTSPTVYGKFMNVLHLKAHPITLFTPVILKSILSKSNRADKRKDVR